MMMGVALLRVWNCVGLQVSMGSPDITIRGFGPFNVRESPCMTCLRGLCTRDRLFDLLLMLQDIPFVHIVCFREGIRYESLEDLRFVHEDSPVQHGLHDVCVGSLSAEKP